MGTGIQKLEEEIKEIEVKRREIRIEVKMLRFQRHSYRTYLLDLKKKVKEKTRANRKLAEKEKENQTRKNAFDDVMEIFSHNCIKLHLEQEMAYNALRFAIDELQGIRMSFRTVDSFIRKSEAEIKEMRHRILKK